MGNRLSPGCCCGCDIFAFTDVLTEAGTTTIDGYKVVNKVLPVNGLWYININPLFSGKFTTDATTFYFRLLKPDNSVFAEWSRSILQENPGSVNQRVSNYSYLWNGVTKTDFSRLRIGTAYDQTFASGTVWGHSIICRPACSVITGQWTSDQSLLLEVIRDHIEDSAQVEADFFLGGPPPVGQLSLGDDDVPTKIVRITSGFNLPTTPELLSSNGPFRFGVKVDLGTDATLATVQATAEKIHQESLSLGDCSSYSGYEAPVTQAEKNEDCTFPYICRVTHPHYTTPIWEVANADCDVTLNSTEKAYEVQKSCISFNSHRRLAPVPEPYNGYASGALNSDADDYGLIFMNNASAYVATEWAWYHTGGSDTDPANYTNGTGPTFRQSSWPFAIRTTIIATEDPCELLVQCEIGIYTFAGPTSTSQVSVQNCFTDTVSGVKWWFRANPQGTISGLSSPVSFQVKTAMFEKVVPIWAHEPPTLSFTSADLIDSPTTWYFLTSATGGNFRRNGGLMRADMTLTSVAVANTSIAFTLQAHSSPRMPHP